MLRFITHQVNSKSCDFT